MRSNTLKIKGAKWIHTLTILDAEGQSKVCGTRADEQLKIIAAFFVPRKYFQYYSSIYFIYFFLCFCLILYFSVTWSHRLIVFQISAISALFALTFLNLVILIFVCYIWKLLLDATLLISKPYKNGINDKEQILLK